MCLYLASTKGFARSKEVTELALQVSCVIIMFRITLTKDAMFEIAQVLDVQEVLWNYFTPYIHPCIIHDAKRHTSSTAIRLVYLRTCEQIILILGIIIVSR